MNYKIQKRITPMQGCQFFVIFYTWAAPMPSDDTLSGLLQSSFLNILSCPKIGLHKKV